ncbi:Translation initiation factor 3 subunit J component [Batrachochytrium dendrobatidis]|nr:Translation initiation factor 3 subunit J component [Batrachochytrium dendrobatidis]KAK5671049.1 Translation initiation factor 3 subunit J component [Batrachochytrium dendrobatidis]
MSGNWDDSEEDVVSTPIAVPGKWDDEDVEDNVKDSWDASDDEKETPAKTVAATVKPTTVAPVKVNKKKALAQKIAERKEEERRKNQESSNPTNDVVSAESDQQRKELLARSVRESDLENARALLGDLALTGGLSTTEGAIESFHPESRGEFDDFVKVIMKKFSTLEDQVQYTYFVESLIRELVIPINVEDTRRISSSLTAMINEKQRVLKESQNKGKKKAAKQVLKTAPAGRGDTTNYDDVYDDFDDFM